MKSYILIFALLLGCMLAVIVSECFSKKAMQHAEEMVDRSKRLIDNQRRIMELYVSERELLYMKNYELMDEVMILQSQVNYWENRAKGLQYVLRSEQLYEGDNGTTETAV